MKNENDGNLYWGKHKISYNLDWDNRASEFSVFGMGQ